MTSGYTPGSMPEKDQPGFDQILRACLVRVRVRMFLYALFYEKDIPN
jgi:hypothetical protein